MKLPFALALGFVFSAVSATESDFKMPNDREWTATTAKSVAIQESGGPKSGASIVAMCAGKGNIQTKLYNPDSDLLAGYKPIDIRVLVDGRQIPVDKSVMKLAPGFTSSATMYWWVDGKDSVLVKALLSGGQNITINSIYSPEHSLTATYTLKGAKKAVSRLVEIC